MSENLDNNLNEQVVESEIEVQPKKKKMLAFKIIIPILYALVTFFTVWMIVDLAITLNNAEGLEGLGVAIVLMVFLPLLIVGAAIALVISLPALIISIVLFAKKKTSLGTMIYFIIFTVYGVMLLLFTIFGFGLIT